MNESSHAAPSAPAESAGQEKPTLLRKILFAILGVMIIAFIYEYGYVRRSYKAAEAAIDDLIDQRNRSPDGGSPTPADVQAAFGKAPVGGTVDKEEYYLEHYQWRRWLPWQTYDIYVVYDHSDPPQLFNSTRPYPPAVGDVPYPGIEMDPALFDAAGPGPGLPGGGPPVPPQPASQDAPVAAQEEPADDAPAETEPGSAAKPSDDEPSSENDSPAETEPAADEPSAADAPPAGKEPADSRAPAEPRPPQAEADAAPEAEAEAEAEADTPPSDPDRESPSTP